MSKSLYNYNSISCPGRGPAHEAETELYRRAMSSETTFFPLEFLFHQFEGIPGVDAVAKEAEAFGKNVETAAQLWTELILVLTNLPWILCQLQDCRISQQEKDALLSRLSGLRSCCHDPGFSKPLFEDSGGDPATLGAAGRQIIEALSRFCQGTNMPLERLLSLFRSQSFVLRCPWSGVA